MNRTAVSLAACALLLAGCVKDAPVGERGGEGECILQLSVSLPDQSRADDGAYDALALSTMRIYSLTDDGEGGTAENLIRKYRPATEVPTDLYLAAGRYRVAVEAGDGSEATFTRKSYAGGETFTLAAGDVKPLPIVCRITNIAVKVVFDGTVAQRFDEGYLAYVSASDDFSKTDAENSLVPTLKYTSDGTGYFLLPEGTKHLSWGFYGTSSDADVSAKGTKTGRIELPEPGMQYTLTFRYSKDADGELTVNVQVREWESSHDDNFNFSPQPAVSGDGFNIGEVTGYHTDPIRFAISSINPLAAVAFAAGEEYYEVMAGGEVVGSGADGISYSRTDAFNGVLTLDGDFFAGLPAGINTLDFLVTDTDGSEGKAAARIAVAGATGLVSSDLWFGTATAGAAVTDPGVVSVKIRYRVQGSDEWTEADAVRGADGYTYTAAVSGIGAGRRYEFRLVTDGSESGPLAVADTEYGVQLPNAGFEEWHQSGKPWYPYAAGGTEFWGTGNPGATTAGEEYNLTTGVEDPRPGSEGRLAAKLETKKPSFFGIGKLAAGNLFVGSFGAVSGMGGTVNMGRPFDFNARPAALRVWYKYTPVGSDKGRIFVCLVNMTDGSTSHTVDTNNAEKTAFLPDDEFLYADKSNPSTLQGHVIGYGDLMLETQVGEWTEVTIPLVYRDKYASERPNVLILTAAASYRGDYFEGEVGSTMFLDDVEFIY